MQSYVIVDDGRAAKGIKCLRCGRVSYYVEDIKHRFCAWCCMFHEDPADMKPPGPQRDGYVGEPTPPDQLDRKNG